jgi:hypothetical protein
MLKEAIHGLRPAFRVVVQAQHQQERSIRETAEAVGISMAATKGRLFHAKKVLRRSLIPKLTSQSRMDNRIRALPAGSGSGRANARTGQQQSNHKEERDDYVSKSEETRKYGAPTNLRSYGDERGFRCEPGA